MAKAEFGGLPGEGEGEDDTVHQDITDQLLDADLILSSFGISENYNHLEVKTDVSEYLNEISNKMETDISFEDENKANLFEYRDISGHLQEEKRTSCDTIHGFTMGGAKVERPPSVIQENMMRTNSGRFYNCSNIRNIEDRNSLVQGVQDLNRASSLNDLYDRNSSQTEINDIETSRSTVNNIGANSTAILGSSELSFPAFLNAREDWKTGFQAGGLGDKEKLGNSLLELQRYLETESIADLNNIDEDFLDQQLTVSHMSLASQPTQSLDASLPIRSLDASYLSQCPVVSQDSPQPTLFRPIHQTNNLQLISLKELKQQQTMDDRKQLEQPHQSEALKLEELPPLSQIEKLNTFNLQSQLFTVPSPLPLSPLFVENKPVFLNPADGLSMPSPDVPRSRSEHSPRHTPRHDLSPRGTPRPSPQSTPRPSPQSTPPPMLCDVPPQRGDSRSWKRSGRVTPTGKRSRPQTPTSEGENSDSGFRDREPHTWGSGRTTPVEQKPPPRFEDMEDEDKYNKRKRSTSAGEKEKGRAKDPLKNMLDELQSIIPHIGNPDEEKVSQAGILVEGSDYIRSLMRENKSTRENVEALKLKIEELNSEIEAAQEKLPEHGTNTIHRIISSRGKSIPDMFADHVRHRTQEDWRHRTQEDWRYWVFTSIMGHFVHTFAQQVSNINQEELGRTAIDWIQSLVCLIVILHCEL
ncbi:uncharacterized protein LOC111717147 isoform X3 [Eurytemora carolleeae]|uniref:uncharacterized protein LOC111717147 isoform X3 n=1 Tax=Eurytemora carolleeae TaxID=1294199 RepID=UPI000C7744D7|nr:uncharacterized protein LOC111717147 isoform X3 [Eurytemora carolleeae]|eukprot:XP_023348421.1 uncharacterized protein LOC111717147 isoform X3 [Eurytemora affinis]